jgi:hypothetical protein
MERGASTCYWQTCDFSVVSVDALRPPPEAQFCEGEHQGSNLRSHRQCEYFTLLRHPIDRLYDSYNHECVACKEDGRHCAAEQEERPGLGALTCPDMTLEAYARYVGNVYTRALAAKAPPLGSDEPARLDVPSPDAGAADRALRQMFVMLESDLAVDAPFVGLADWMSDPASGTLKGLAAPQINPFAEQQSSRPEISAEARQAISDDIWLYERAVRRRTGVAA